MASYCGDMATWQASFQWRGCELKAPESVRFVPLRANLPLNNLACRDEHVTPWWVARRLIVAVPMEGRILCLTSKPNPARVVFFVLRIFWKLVGAPFGCVLVRVGPHFVVLRGNQGKPPFWGVLKEDTPIYHQR